MTLEEEIKQRANGIYDSDNPNLTMEARSLYKMTETGYIQGAKDQDPITKKKIIEKSCKYWFEHLKGFLGEGLAMRVVDEYKNEILKDNDNIQ